MRHRETESERDSVEWRECRIEYSRVEKRREKQASVEVYETGKHLDKEGETILNNVYE